MPESACEIRARPWRGPEAPARILAIRLQAIGDVAVTLPYLRALQQSLPETEIDMVTRKEVGELASAVNLFRHVDELGGGRHERRQLMLAAFLAPRLRTRLEGTCTGRRTRKRTSCRGRTRQGVLGLVLVLLQVPSTRYRGSGWGAMGVE